MREERLQERVREIRPELRKARELVEKAASENRELTAEEQKTYDEIMAKGRSVADAVKQHRHDEEVYAFARELADEVGVPLSHDDLSSSGSGSKSRRLSFKAMGAKVAARRCLTAQRHWRRLVRPWWARSSSRTPSPWSGRAIAPW